MKRRMIGLRVNTLVIKSDNLILTSHGTDRYREPIVIKECNDELIMEKERLTDMIKESIEKGKQLEEELKNLREGSGEKWMRKETWSTWSRGKKVNTTCRSYQEWTYLQYLFVPWVHVRVIS